jgi:hypothetical protein
MPPALFSVRQPTAAQVNTPESRTLWRSRSGTWVESVIHDFCVKTNCTDGEDPLAPLTIDSSGNLFGVTTLGGSDINCESGEGCGTVFELKKKTPSGEPGSNDLP